MRPSPNPIGRHPRVRESGIAPDEVDDVRTRRTRAFRLERADPADRLVWARGDAAQCDLWFPPTKVPLEDETRFSPPVLVIVAAHSRFVTAVMIPTRKTGDLLLGPWELIHQVGGSRGA